MNDKKDQLGTQQLSATRDRLNHEMIVGILPLIHMKHFLFGNKLVSMPFFDLGGVLADSEHIEKALVMEALKLAQKLGVKSIELRHTGPLEWLAHSSQLTAHGSGLHSGPTAQRSCETAIQPPNNQLSAISYELSAMSYELSAIRCSTSSHKVRMSLELPDSSEALMKSFKSKLRSQIKKPMKEGLKAIVGGLELLNDFYCVFTVNMRDLGSPVHAEALMKNVMQAFPEKARIIIVYKETEPVACSLVVGFKDVLENPWASALRKYSRLAPNMLLYWTMLEYACNNGFRYFDFGRSSPGEGTYKFKKQWGSQPCPLHWQYLSLDGKEIEDPGSEKSRFDIAIQYWQKLPVPVTRVLGPMIRKHIAL